ncbi:MAG: 3-oxoacyl-ACP reductase FabG [Kiritimatiellia bacterium]|jgi:3-oxoacyl-[acyl-carrier protein] reductase
MATTIPTPSSGTPALVTGASGAIGSAIARALHAAGHPVALASHGGIDLARALAESLGNGAVALPPRDLARPEAAADLFADAEAALGSVGVVVCNAGLQKTQFLALSRFEDWRETMNVNLDSVFCLMKAAARAMMRRKSGRIVVISSAAALLGDALHSAYSASKAGLLGLVRSAARELADSGVTVNAVAPGVIETPMTDGLAGARRERQLARVPMGRFGTPQEVASAVRFLASDDAAYITGQVLSVDGGLCMKG